MKKKIAISLEEIVDKMIERDISFEDYNSINVEVNKNGEYNHVWIHRNVGETSYRLEYTPNKPLELFTWIAGRGWTSVAKYG